MPSHLATNCLHPARSLAPLTSGLRPSDSAALDPLQQADWDARVAAYSGASFFHSAAWARVLVNTYGYTPAYFTASRVGKLQALLPVMEVNSWLTGRRGVALPFTDDCQPLAPDAAAFQELFRTAVAHGQARGWKYLECRGGRSLFADVPASVSYYGHRLNLVGDPDYLCSRFESSVRRAIRKAEKAGVKVEISQRLGAMHTFYSLQCRTRKKHGLPPQPFSFFRNIYQSVIARDLGMIAIATHNGRPIAAAVYFYLGDRAIFKYGASDETFQPLRGPNLVMWEAIKWCAGLGMKTLHLGRTSATNEGLRRFKLAWHAEEEEIEYLKYDLRHKRFVTDTDAASGWYNRVFRVLPIWTSRLIGAALYRHSA